MPRCNFAAGREEASSAGTAELQLPNVLPKYYLERRSELMGQLIIDRYRRKSQVSSRRCR
jgi:hypothetical protein